MKGRAAAPLQRVRALLAREPATVIFVAAVVVLQVVLLLWMRISFRVLGWRAEGELLLSTVGSALLIALLVERVVRRGRGAVLAVAWLAITLLAYIDTLFFRAFQDFPSYAAAGRTRELMVVRAAVLPLMHGADVLLWVAAVGVAALLWRSAGRRLRPRVEWGAGMLAGALAIATPWVVNRALRGPSHGHLWVAGKTGLLVYHARDLIGGMTRWEQHARPVDPTRVALARAELERSRAAIDSLAPSLDSASLAPFGFARGLNVLLVQVESLQGFTIDGAIGGHPIAPFLHRLAHDNLYFDNFFAEVGEGTTADADLLVHCSLYPPRRGVAYVEYPSAGYDCLPRRLRAAGYSTIAYHGMSPDFWNRGDMYQKLGFDRFMSMLDFRGAEKIGLGVSDKAFFARVAADLSRVRQPFYAYTVTLTSHLPFEAPQLPHEPAFYARGRTLAAHYVNSIHYADEALAEFFDALAQRGLLDHTIVLVYGDHAGIHRGADGFEFVSGISPDNRLQAFLSENQIPLIVVLPPALRRTRTISSAAGEVDLAPSLLYALGLPIPPWYFGKPLWETGARLEVMHSGAAAAGDRLWLLDGGGGLCLEHARIVSDAECATIRTFGSDLLETADYLIAGNALRSFVSGFATAGPRVRTAGADTAAVTRARAAGAVAMRAPARASTFHHSATSPGSQE